MRILEQEQIVALLAEALKRDPKAITELVAARIPCNEALANHPTIVCGMRRGVRQPKSEAQLTIGVLGILNGLFPEGPRIAAVYGETKGPIIEFRLVEREPG